MATPNDTRKAFSTVEGELRMQQFDVVLTNHVAQAMRSEALKQKTQLGLGNKMDNLSIESTEQRAAEMSEHSGGPSVASASESTTERLRYQDEMLEVATFMLPAIDQYSSAFDDFRELESMFKSIATTLPPSLPRLDAMVCGLSRGSTIDSIAARAVALKEKMAGLVEAAERISELFRETSPAQLIEAKDNDTDGSLQEAYATVERYLEVNQQFRKNLDRFRKLAEGAMLYAQYLTAMTDPLVAAIRDSASDEDL